MKLKIKLIINPSSGRQTVQQTVTEIIGYLMEAQALERVDFRYTQSPHDAWNEAALIQKGEYHVLLVVGGDGTINEAVNGLMEGGSQTPLAILAAGTVNDFATYMELPTDAYHYANMLKDFHTTKVDIGKAGSRYFLNVAAGGLLTDIAYKVAPESKTVLGRAAYWLEGAKSIPANLLSGIPLTFESEEDYFSDEALLFIVANTSRVGGFKNLAPYAELTDGLLDILIVSKLEFQGVFPLLSKLLTNDHLNNENIIYFQATHVSISSTQDNPVRLDLDGEAGDLLPVVIKCIPKALTLLIP